MQRPCLPISSSPWLPAAACALLLSGCLGGQTGTEGRDDDGRGGGFPTPAESDCSGTRVPTADDDAAGFSIEQAVALVNRSPGLVLTWETGGVTDVTVRAAETTEQGCLRGAGDGATLSAPVVLVIRTGDGRIDSRLVGSLTARAAIGGGLASATIQAAVSCAAGAPSSWAIACGLAGFDLAASEGVRVEVDARFEPGAADVIASGRLEVLGGEGGGCLPNGACSSPIWQPIEAASFASE